MSNDGKTISYLRDKKQYTFEQLLEITQRDTHKYLDEVVVNQLTEFILSHIDYEDYNIMGVVTSIVSNVGLKNVWKEILSKKSTIENINVVKLIEDCGVE